MFCTTLADVFVYVDDVGFCLTNAPQRISPIRNAQQQEMSGQARGTQLSVSRGTVERRQTSPSYAGRLPDSREP
jgi:hypothetical protein